MKRVFAALLTLAVTGALVPNATAEGSGVVPLQAEGGAAKGGAAKGGKEGKPKKKRVTDAQVRQLLIDESIAAYSGNCPCPYNRARNGSRCGRRSAYDREGGEAPLCFSKDVTPGMVQAYRDANPEE